MALTFRIIKESNNPFFYYHYRYLFKSNFLIWYMKFLCLLIFLLLFSEVKSQIIPFSHFKTIVSGGSYESESTALFDRMTNQPDNTRKTVINNLISSLKTNGIWSKLDLLYIFASHDEQSSLLNWKSTSYNCSKVNSPTFTTDRGFSTSGSPNYITTNYNPSTNGVNYTLNSCSMGVYNRTNSGGNSGEIGVYVGSNYAYILITNGSNNYSSILNTTTGSVFNLGTYIGFFSTNRSSNTSMQFYRNGSNFSSPTNTSSSIPNQTIFILCISNNGSPATYSNKQISVAFVGGSLNSTEQSNFNTAVETYMDAVGGGVQ